jgi:SAM-dependent methyltransferase
VVPSLTRRLRRAARLGLSRLLRIAIGPCRTAARTAIRLRPSLEPRLGGWAWLWQPGWGRRCHERLYSRRDPYGLATNGYEQSKYDLIIETLASGSYARGLEVGCGEGLLTERLAPLCRELVGVDISEAAIDRARALLAGQEAGNRVSLERRTLPFDILSGTFDLIVCSDVLYYWEPATLQVGLDRLLERLRPGGTLLLLHYLGGFGQASTGDAVHDLAARRAGECDELVHLVAKTVAGVGPGGAGLRVDVLSRRPALYPAGAISVTVPAMLRFRAGAGRQEP